MRVLWVASALVSLSGAPAAAKTFYLDGNLSGPCSGTYSVASRSCAGSDGDAVGTIQAAMNALAGGDTLLIRSGSYTNAGYNPYAPDFGAYITGSLHVTAGGSSDSSRTVISGFPGEQPVIYTAAGKLNYPPDSGDTNYTNSSHWYAWPAVSVNAGQYVTIRGLKTYGQVCIQSTNHVLIDGNDIGGGGPTLNQGQALWWEDSDGVVVRNNTIHHSVWGQSVYNGSGIQFYQSTDDLIENNYFHSNYGADISTKDSRFRNNAGDIVIRFNLFDIGTYESHTGITTWNQYPEVARLLVTQNVFFRKANGVMLQFWPSQSTWVTNNTFVDCANDGWAFWDSQVRWFNNLHYHSAASDPAFYVNWYGTSDAQEDYNLFYASAGAPQFRGSGGTASDLAFWRGSFGLDEHSVTKDPGFVNPGGTAAADFKRTSYAGDVTGSPYGPICGAYLTGDEVIGPSTGAAPTRIPSRPGGLTVQ